MVGQQTLNLFIGVQIPAPEQNYVCQNHQWQQNRQ